MVYFDTSFLAPLLLEETPSSAVERFIAGLPAGTLAVSHWTRVEFASLLAREVRMGGLDQPTAREVGAEFEAIVAESFVVLLPSARDYTLARQYLGHHDSGLRAGDALHLAIAQNNRAEAIYSFDKTLLRAGPALGLPVSIGIHTD
jgi:predicted nucleic acid-binding protein